MQIISNIRNILICCYWEMTAHLKSQSTQSQTLKGFLPLFCRQHNLPVGVSAGAAAGQKHLSQVHQVDAEGQGHFQAGWLQSCIQTVGETQEQAWHELWDYGQSPQVSFHNIAKQVIYEWPLWLSSMEVITLPPLLDMHHSGRTPYNVCRNMQQSLCFHSLFYIPPTSDCWICRKPCHVSKMRSLALSQL